MRGLSYTFPGAPFLHSAPVPLTKNQTFGTHGAPPLEDLDNLYGVAPAHLTDRSLNTLYFPDPIFESV